MKNFCITALIIISSQLNLLGQSTILKMIEIKYVNPRILTLSAVRCEEFDSSFSREQYKYKNITESVLLDKFGESLQGIKYFGKSRAIDVRYKLTFYFNANLPNLVICMSHYNDATLDGKIIANCSLLKLLKETIHNID